MLRISVSWFCFIRHSVRLASYLPGIGRVYIFIYLIWAAGDEISEVKMEFIRNKNCKQRKQCCECRECYDCNEYAPTILSKLLYFWHWKICFWNTIIFRVRLRKLIKTTLEELPNRLLEQAFNCQDYDFSRIYRKEN